jgi:RAD51-like protein 2
MFISADLDRESYRYPTELGTHISDSQAILTASQRSIRPPISQSVASLISRTQNFVCSYAAVNAVLGGGLPRGRILEISGPPGSFKEALALDYMRLFVEANEEVIFIGDSAFHLTCNFFLRNGVQIPRT